MTNLPYIFILGTVFLCNFEFSNTLEITSNDVGMQLSNLFENCFKTDSISCIQIGIYRGVKSFFDQDNIDLSHGFSFVREEDNKVQRTARSGEETVTEEQIQKSSDVEQRESALESYVFEKVLSFLKGRSLRWNLSPVVKKVISSARSFITSLPANFRQRATELITEGRAKRKILKTLIPLLIGLKLKKVAVIGIVFIAIALIAKKAILVSLISLAISAFLAISKSRKHDHHEYYGYHGPHGHHDIHDTFVNPHGYGGHGHFAGYSAHGGGYGLGFDSSGYGHGDYASHSSPLAHNLPYGGQKSARR